MQVLIQAMHIWFRQVVSSYISYGIATDAYSKLSDHSWIITILKMFIFYMTIIGV